MRILTVRQPWAWAIIHGGKDVENRSRNIAGDYRGPVAIHAGLAPFEQHNMASRAHHDAHGTEVPTAIGFGAIIGVVDLVDVHWCFTACNQVPINFPGVGDGIAHVTCSEWGTECSFHLSLASPRLLPEPIPYRGALGLRELPAEVEQQIWQQIGGGR